MALKRVCPFCLGKPIYIAKQYVAGNRLKVWSDPAKCPMCGECNYVDKEVDIDIILKAEPIPERKENSENEKENQENGKEPRPEIPS